jgi:alpha-amylase/alpha-mannosidase (GH57 family)
MPLRSFCIHAHFYQPPREDPLTGIIPIEAGASPFPNWNERIHAECYRPNAERGNFTNISFNIGPTLCNWMVGHDSKTWSQIVAQDRLNLERYGVGNAMAQAYNHTILPLASYQDKVTQVAWGIADFEHRFGRKPQGMWLPETAVDYDTLSILAARGVEFTILAPWQADQEDLDVTRPYRVPLPDGKSIVVFFYQRDLSGGISFNPPMTINADNFARYDLLSRYPASTLRVDEPQLILIATDGELYGHHQPHRDQFLAHLLNGSIRAVDIQPTFPALWLKQFPVRHSVGIREATSWSCHHGVSRWLGTCDCTPGDGSWKAQLRLAFARLSQAVDDLFVQTVRSDIADPWDLRDRYIQVMLGAMTAEELINEMAGRRLSQERLVQLHLLLEAQRERQRMYTSCGWFFDDFNRIEPKNNLAYAAQAVRLTRLATGLDLEPYVLKDLSKVISPHAWLRADQMFSYFLKRAVLDGRIVAGD